MVSINIKSMAFWSALAGAASIVCGALGLGTIAPDVKTMLLAIGGILVAIPAHHVTAKQQGTAPAVTQAPPQRLIQ